MKIDHVIVVHGRFFKVDSAFNGGRFTAVIATRGDELIDVAGFVHPATASSSGNEFRNTSVTIILSGDLRKAKLPAFTSDAVVACPREDISRA
jgi:hypothetical protein